ncbi:uncharacterized protein LOC143912038 [Arctopsyche grandis]|uniref:uncharacterized protein LOC143912038 n=1 Tax=Arctopsyche grandis TaxID=121162 RepID=UPI00406D7B65
MDEVFLVDLVWEGESNIINDEILSGKATPCDCRIEIINDVKIPPEETILLKTSDKIRSTHSELNYKINIQQKKSYTIHLKFHTREKPYMCGICLKNLTLCHI